MFYRSCYLALSSGNGHPNVAGIVLYAFMILLLFDILNENFGLLSLKTCAAILVEVFLVRLVMGTRPSPRRGAGGTGQVKILINATTLVKGGALQAAASLFQAFESEQPDCQWHWAVSGQLAEQLQKIGASLEPAKVDVLGVSPARSPGSRRALLDLEARIQPDIVFTVFGPAYVRFRARHICGIADGWVSHPTVEAYRTLGRGLRRLVMLLTVAYKAHWFRTADAWIVEAAVAKSGLVRRYGFRDDRIATVANGCGRHFLANQADDHTPEQRTYGYCACLPTIRTRTWRFFRPSRGPFATSDRDSHSSLC